MIGLNTRGSPPPPPPGPRKMGQQGPPGAKKRRLSSKMILDHMECQNKCFLARFELVVARFGPPPGGATPRFWTPTTPPTNCRSEAPWGGGGGLGGGGLGGAPGRAVPGGGGGRFPGFPWGGGVSGTSEQLGMRRPLAPWAHTFDN